MRTRLLALLLAMLLPFFLTGPARAHKDHPQQAAAVGTAASGTSADSPEMAGAMPAHDAAPGHMAAEPRPTSFAGRLVDWLGRWHPSVVHFPIALFIVAGALEAWAIVRRRPSMLETTRILVALGALGALVAVALGWMAMGWNLAEDKPLETAHRLLGSTIAGLALVTWWANNRFLRRRGTGAGALYGGLLGLTVLAIGVNGYLGGALIHGVDHLAF
ncbi:DUF2231 domain-containing protein [Phenylobacterium sp.]|uniref:DUF2231 domain-containing protein n=1 Tax=Phenylobacterium sp. TaxID=1871053 RepID=UPI0035C7CA6E